jgi:hypothetical protein
MRWDKVPAPPDDLYEYEYAYDENGVFRRIAIRAINADGNVTELPP